MAKKSLLQQISELQKPENPDFDIEDSERGVFDHQDEEDESASEDEDDLKKSEHYVNVGKSKLRDHSINLRDAKYTGKSSSRKELFDDEAEVSEDDDEEFDDEEDSETEEEGENLDGDSKEAFGEESEEGELQEEDREGDSGISLREDSEDEEQSESESEPSTDREDFTFKRDKLKQMMANERKTILNRLSTSAQSDALKGYAVIFQQRLFDTIIDSRIKLQKGLTNSNLLPLNNEIFNEFQEDEAEDILSITEASLHSLLDNIISLRTKIYNKEKITKDELKFKTGKKRSFSDYVKETGNLDTVLNKYRANILTKWSHKVQSASGATALNASKFKTINQSPAQQVEINLMDMDRLIKRTRMNRRNVKPLGYVEDDDEEETKIDRSLQEDENIFDDEDFYRVLLNDLIDKKISDSNPTNGMTIQLTKAKVKKNVDTKASKGRKLKYTVQEPIQNYEAPKSKFKWSDEQIDELFAGLLGQKVNFNEDDESDNEEVDDEDQELLNDGIKIFG